MRDQLNQANKVEMRGSMMRKIIQNIIIILIFLGLGFILILQFKNVDKDYEFVTIKTMSELQNLVDKEREEIRNLEELITLKEKRLKEYEEAQNEEGSIIEVLQEEIQLMKMAGGFTDVEGPGVMILLSDSNRELREGEDPNNVIIHDGDVLAIINELKYAGAEAIAVGGGQRLMSTSEIFCTADTLMINGHYYGQPFRIKAIGNPRTLVAAINAPGSYASFLRDVYGIGVELEVSPRIRISRYMGDIEFKYGTPREGD